MRTKNALQLRPLADRVIISRNSQEEKSPGGIVIPQTAHQEKPQFGVVVAVGPGAMQESGERGIMDVRVTDKVCFSRFGGQEIEVEGDTYVIMRQDDIIAVVG